MILGAALLAAPFVGLIAWQSFERAASVTQATEALALERAQAAATSIRQFIDATRVDLEALARRPLVRALDQHRCDPILPDLLELEPLYANVSVVDPAGRIYCSALPQSAGSVSVADRPWFQDVLRSRAFTVSDALVDRLTGTWIVILAQPIQDAGGRLIGVAAASIDVAALGAEVVDRALAPRETITLLDGAGTVVTRHPDAAHWVGRGARDAEAGRIAIRGATGAARAMGVDGLERLYGYATIAGTDWVAYAGIPVADAFADANAAAYSGVLIALLVAAVAVALAILVGRVIAHPVEALARSVEAEGGSDPRSRVRPGGFRETVALAERFNALLERRRRAEDDLRERAAQLAQAQRIAHLGSWDRDLTNDTSRWSDEMFAIYGMEPGTYGGTHEAFLASVHPDDRAAVQEASRAAVEDGAAYGVDFHIVRPDGTVRTVHEEGELIRDEAGHPIRFVGTCQDVTERVRAEAAVRASEERFRSLIEHMPDGVFVLTPDLRIEDANQAASAMLGAARAELLARPLADFTVGGRAPSALLVADDQTADQIRSECGFTHPDGSTLTVELSSRRLADGRTLALARDVTARAAAEAERLRLLAALEQSGDAITVSQIDGPIEYVNSAFERLYGYRPSEVVGQSQRVLNSGRHSREFWDHVWAVVGAGGTWSGTIVNQRKDGTLVEVESVISGFRDANGQPAGMVRADRDVTRERALEAQLRQSQKTEAVGQLAGGIAHDFNNLLTASRGYADLARSGFAPDDDDVGADLDEVIRATDRAAELTRQLLAFSRRQVLAPRVVDPLHAIAAIETMLRRLLGEHIEIAVHGRPGSAIRVDPSQFEQVIVNLAVNARDAMPEGGRLTIDTSPIDLDATYAATHPGASTGAHVMVAVSDTGLGMDAETQARIFEPFFTTKEPGRGTGMGLATVYGIVTQSGGSIDVSSEPGRGATFRVYFPASTDAAEPTAEAAPAVAIPGGSESILVVEDEGAVRGFAKRALSRLGYRVVDAASGEEALATAAAHDGPIDLLITDVIMPGMGGVELAERLAAACPGLRVLYVSGYTEHAVMRRRLDDGEIAYVPKPFDAMSLGRAVRAVLDRAEPLAGTVAQEGDRRRS